MSRRLLWIALWVVSIVATAQYVRAQTAPDRFQDRSVLSAPVMVTGGDLAFRVQSYGPGQTAVGQLMVRVNGIWQAAVPAPSEGRIVPTNGK